VLLVDDQLDTLEMLRAALEQQCRAEVRTSAEVGISIPGTYSADPARKARSVMPSIASKIQRLPSLC